MTYNIINEPEEAKRYEFVVAKPMDDEDTYLFIGMYKNVGEAEKAARDNGATIIHNVRIQGYEEPSKERHYTFSGTWSWDCFAESKEEAITKWEEAYYDDYEIDDYDDILID